MIMQKSGKLI